MWKRILELWRVREQPSEAAVRSSDVVVLLLRKIESELDEIELSMISARHAQEWRRHDGLDASRVTLLGIKRWILNVTKQHNAGTERQPPGCAHTAQKRYE